MSLMCSRNVRADAPGSKRSVSRIATSSVEQRLLDGAREPLRLRGRRHAALRADEQRIAIDRAQPRERVADRRLRHAELLRRAAHVAGGVDGVERLQQVEVDAVAYS